MKFRELRADEVEVRIGQVSQNGKGLSLLLYKTARTDMDILDETVGSENWQCRFYENKGTLFCSVGIRIRRENGTSEWVWKDDAGAPSNMEAQKGEASDCRKRAGSAWGIGRSLYTAPFIWVPSDKLARHFQDGRGKWVCQDRFAVTGIAFTDGRISYLQITNASTGAVVYDRKES